MPEDSFSSQDEDESSENPRENPSIERKSHKFSRDGRADIAAEYNADALVEGKAADRNQPDRHYHHSRAALEERREEHARKKAFQRR